MLCPISARSSPKADMETCEEVLNILSPKPLRISKQRLKIESLVNSASCDALRCFIPRRHSASSIRCKADYISSSRIPLLEGPEEIPQTTKTGNRGPSLLLQPSPILAFSDMPMGRVHLVRLLPNDAERNLCALTVGDVPADRRRIQSLCTQKQTIYDNKSHPNTSSLVQFMPSMPNCVSSARGLGTLLQQVL